MTAALDREQARYIAAQAAERAGQAAKAEAYLAKVRDLTQGSDSPISDSAQARRLLGR